MGDFDNLIQKPQNAQTNITTHKVSAILRDFIGIIKQK
jgi:hypothetical protein